MSSTTPLLLLTLLLPAADQAQLLDGRRVTGSLGLDESRRLLFTAESKAPIASERLALVPFPALDLPPFRVAGALRLLLRDGQTLTGPLVRLDAESVVIQPAWSKPVKAPRSAVLALTQLPGWQLLFQDDFSAGLGGWTVQGKPEIQKDPTALLLSRPGQELSWIPARPLEAGRVGINFEQRQPPGRGRWSLELSFQEGKRERQSCVSLWPIQARLSQRRSMAWREKPGRWSGRPAGIG